MRIVGITGTPGTGKTTVCYILEKRGFSVLYINKLAKENPGLITGYDKKRKTAEINTSKANAIIKKAIKKNIVSLPLLIDSHFAHLLGIDTAIVLRCSPNVLRKRLNLKNYSERKIAENVEAEAVDVVTIDCIQVLGKYNVYEINTTRSSPELTAKAVLEIFKLGKIKARRKYGVGKIDWLGDVNVWS